jgi:methylenetetrahydrofolate dehydrogenase (NADP+)/methenyltetrahydrofolate cyclohydrolase
MILLDGRSLSEKILASIRPTGSLHIILVGDDPASLKYVSLKKEKCRQIGLNCVVHHLPTITPTPDILTLINNLNNDVDVTGFFVQLPLPPHLNRSKILNAISRNKDVDGLAENSLFLPAVVKGIIRLLDEYHISLSGKNAVIINDSPLIGIPLKKALEKRRVTVTLCNDKTKSLPEVCQKADLLVSATGVKNLVTAQYIKPEAIVVDVANGDVDFEQVAPLSSYITPTFGGVGPMTIACLLENMTMVE